MTDQTAPEQITDFLEEAARYFEGRNTNGEDKAHWSNIYNAENCRKAADTLAAQQAVIDELVAALRPFSEIAGEMFARNWNIDQSPVLALDNPERENHVTVADFFQARAALAKAKEMGT
ncbi:hypothetical protein [Sulfitobacter sp. 20_GPM-1509m]|uniref:hypothetical protein n=1 Tax=Sulfitobacter sp. 20_GPM-1509m TaxID=1380367 RepID=UPI00048A7E7E|nr:hypothetical protein [Sulfitobacter sp. 20_GPM-1509m]